MFISTAPVHCGACVHSVCRLYPFSKTGGDVPVPACAPSFSCSISSLYALCVVYNTGAVSHIVNPRSTCPTSSSSPRRCAWTACTCSGAAFSLLCLVSRALTFYAVSCDTKGQTGWQVAKRLSSPLKACKATHWVVRAMLGPRPRLLLIACGNIVACIWLAAMRLQPCSESLQQRRDNRLFLAWPQVVAGANILRVGHGAGSHGRPGCAHLPPRLRLRRRLFPACHNPGFSRSCVARSFISGVPHDACIQVVCRVQPAALHLSCLPPSWPCLLCVVPA